MGKNKREKNQQCYEAVNLDVCFVHKNTHMKSS